MPKRDIIDQSIVTYAADGRLHIVFRNPMISGCAQNVISNKYCALHSIVEPCLKESLSMLLKRLITASTWSQSVKKQWLGIIP
ncbi:hypothetical protein CFP56_017142 [Quercus suber]|uniref:Uncharacterized protein n=1 Tax=Quercus suber TaxID=58331 RepID=A0AAW0M3E4_QUESU